MKLPIPILALAFYSSFAVAQPVVPTRTCAQDLTEWCTSNTALGPERCFKRSVDECGSQPEEFSGCVIRNAEYCQTKTSLSDLDCFNESLKGCRRILPSAPAPRTPSGSR